MKFINIPHKCILNINKIKNISMSFYHHISITNYALKTTFLIFEIYVLNCDTYLILVKSHQSNTYNISSGNLKEL